MTQEEKARAYDEALKKAKFYHGNCPSEPERKKLEKMFPVLHESEDERIRKEIIKYLKLVDKGEGDYAHPIVSGWIAYLEKQKDLDKMIVVSPEVWDNAIADAYENGKKEGEKQKEPHYTKRNALFDKCVKNCDPAVMKKVSDEVDGMLGKEQKPIGSAEESLGISQEEYNKIVDECIYGEQKEQKQSLSEKIRPISPAAADFVDSVDNMEKNKAIEILEDYLKWAVSSEEECQYTWKELADSIQLGIDAMKEQKPAEWSEVDEDMLNSCISSIEEAKENRYAYKETDGDTSYDHEIAWLKSLRPFWKPSEEQMEALDKAIPVCMGVVGRDEVAPLESLYENLKKL